MLGILVLATATATATAIATTLVFGVHGVCFFLCFVFGFWFSDYIQRH
jgi:hypothetical protein